MSPWLSAWWPSVAVTCCEEITSSLTGSAPLASVFASCVARSNVKPPVISEPLRGVDAVRDSA